ncbi:MAG: OmpA family protein [Bacteroidales bacterium]|nr:OmpA family protein [Bacteroidales bacterium]
MKKAILIILIIFINNTVFSQTLSTKNKRAIEYFNKALKYYNSYNYKEAVYWSEAALDKDKKFIEVYYLLSDIYGENKLYDKKILALKKAISIKPQKSALAYFTLAKTELSIGRYEDAKQDFELLKKYDVQKRYLKSINKYVTKCNFGIEAMKHPVNFKPVNLGKNINSQYDEYLPSLTADEQTLIFTRLIPSGKISYDGTVEKQEDFYFSKKVNGIFSKAKALGSPLNTLGNEGAQSISADGKLLFFTSCEYDRGKSYHGLTFGSCDIFVSHKTGKKWSKPKNLGKPVNSKYWESQPSFSSDGKTLYFASNRPGGKGGIDIWKTVMKKDSSWSQPVNLGDTINTSGHEQSPFIHYDNKTLYFASNGHPGMGKSDLFLSRKDSTGHWEKPQNLGYPINTFDEEVSLVLNAKGDKAYFASSKKSEFGGIDLYTFEMTKENKPQQVTYIQGVVYDKETSKRLSSVIKLINLKTQKEVALASSDELTGRYLVCLPAGENFAFTVSKSGYLFFSENFSVQKNDDSLKTYHFDIPLSPVKKGEKTILKNIFFDTDSYELKKISFIELDNLVKFMRNNPKVKIEIGGHTDNTGNEQHNRELSLKRAKSVYNYLIKRNIEKARLTYKGYGSKYPVEKNDTEEGKQKNRRTEIKVL